MATAVIMPKAGMAMETGTIIRWLKSVGDRVEVGENLLEIETDKVAMEVEAEVAGVLLAQLRGEGDVVPVIETIGWIGEAGERVPAGKATDTPAAASDDAPRPEPARSAESVAGGDTGSANGAPAPRPAASPAARRRANELGVDLAATAAAAGGRPLVVADVEAAVANRSSATASGGAVGRISPLAARDAIAAGVPVASVTGTGAGGRVLRRDVAEQGATLRRPAGSEDDPRRPVGRTTLAGIRRVIADRMVASHSAIPPVTLHGVAEVDRLVALRAELNDGGDLRVSLNDLVLLAVARALRACPWMRVALEDGEIVEFDAVNLGMAVALDHGLVVPVIRDADTLTLSALSATTRDLGKRARERKLGVDDLSGGTFSVSNLGMFGVRGFTPIINQPEAAILGVGAIRREIPADPHKGDAPVRVMDLSLTHDHRLIDGAQGALFLQQVVRLLERPTQALV